ncbi:50S ribosomal protein L11 methyltransferase [Rickettsia endosymbiont of Pantilius tunicatus]
MNKNGYLVLSGFLDNQIEEVRNAYEKIGFEIKKVIHKNSWIILIAVYYK